MIDGKRVLAVVPARGGSKRLPRKNVLELNGKPMITWTIEAALNCMLIDKVVVSTDDLEISAIAKSCGADVPFLRPANLSTDLSSSIDVVTHTLDFLQNSKEYFEIVVLLQPTSPLRCSETISEALNYYSAKQALGVISVCRSEHSPIWSNTLNESMEMKGFLPDKYKNVRGQDLPVYYRINGAIYISDVATLKAESTFMLEDKLFAFGMSTLESIDIDELEDFHFAEYMMAKLKL